MTFLVCGTCSGKGYTVQAGPGHVDRRFECRACAGTGLRPRRPLSRYLDRDHHDRLKDAGAEHAGQTGEPESLPQTARRLGEA